MYAAAVIVTASSQSFSILDGAKKSLISCRTAPSPEGDFGSLFGVIKEDWRACLRSVLIWFELVSRVLAVNKTKNIFKLSGWETLDSKNE